MHEGEPHPPMEKGREASEAPERSREEQIRELKRNVMLINAIEGDETDQRAAKEAYRILGEIKEASEEDQAEHVRALGAEIAKVNATDRTDTEAIRAIYSLVKELGGASSDAEAEKE